MKYVTESGKEIKVTAKDGDKESPWNPSGNHYRVTVSTGSKRATFNFWDSYHNMINAIPVNLRSALSCFASDAMVGMNANSADDIASEFGYDKPSEAVRVFRGVKQAQKQAERLGLAWDDLAELAEY